MTILNQITQSHLAVLVMDKDSHNPIARMPIYAEISIVETTPPYVIGSEEAPLHLKPEIAALVRSRLPLFLDEDTFRLMAPQMKDDFLLSISKTLGLASNFSGHPENEQIRLVDEAITKALAELDLSPSPQPLKQTMHSYPLGFLATDHVGYVSFDLIKFSENHVFDNNGMNTPAKREYAAFVYPMGKEGNRFDALAQARLSKDAIFAKLEIALPIFETDLKSLNLPSMQRPGLVDWYLSPGSFASKPEFLVGEDGCEHLVPAQLALHQFNLRQVVRVGNPPENYKIPPEFKFGYVDEYRASWYSLGHSLGEILYSLPLAPGESVKLAVIDWSWDSLTKRDETTKLTENVLHQTHRDRTITETVNAALNEWQRGGSIMGGNASAISLPIKMIQISGTNSIGGAYSTSSGSRELAASNVQRLADSLTQASAAQREINSTVVIQARQEEKESIQTRTFTNYNHSHTLTIWYYEVLRHFRVEVEWVRRRPAVLAKLPVRLATLDDPTLVKHRFLLERALLDPTLKAGFDALEKRDSIAHHQKVHGINPAESVPAPWWEGDVELELFELCLRAPDDTVNSITVYVITAEDHARSKKHELHYVYKGDFGPNYVAHNINSGKRMETKDSANNNEFWTFLKLAGQPNDGASNRIKWNDVLGFQIEKWGDTQYRIDLLAIRGWDRFGFVVNFTEGKVPVNLYIDDVEPGSTTFSAIKRPGPRPAPPVPVLSPEKSLSAEEAYQLKRLRDHVAAHIDHYASVIQLGTSETQIARQFEDVPWAPGVMADHVDPTPLEVFGSYVAYPLIEEGKVTDQFIQELFNAVRSADPEQQRQAITMLANLSEKDMELVATRFVMKKAKSEKLITLPTRGVFAEGKLGHCNISEEIDNTRFWKWEEHPIPFEAPGINPVTPVTPQPQQTNVAPTPFPQSLVNIVNPSPAPDPTGLSDALKLLATPNIFRDMSGRAEVADLLKKLSDNSVSFAEAANKAREIQGKYGANLLNNSGGQNGANPLSNSGGASGTTGGASGKPSSSPTQDKLDDVKKSQSIANDLPPSEKKKLYPVMREQVRKSLESTPFRIDFIVNWGGIASRPGLGGLMSNGHMEVALRGNGEGREGVDIGGGSGRWESVDNLLRIGTASISIDPNHYPIPTGLSQDIQFPGGTFEGITVPSVVLNRSDKPLLNGAVEYGVPLDKTVMQVNLLAQLSLKTIEFSITLTAGASVSGEIEIKLSGALQAKLDELGITSGLEYRSKVTESANVGGTLQIKYSVDVVMLDPKLGISVSYK